MQLFCLCLFSLLAACAKEEAFVKQEDAAENVGADGPLARSPESPQGAASENRRLSTDLPGLVLWLAQGVGISSSGHIASQWVDQTVYKHRLVSEVEASSPLVTLDEHGTGLRFSGQGRLAMANELSAQARRALTLGTDDFLIALVAKPDALAAAGAPQFLWAMGPLYSSAQPSLPSGFVTAQMRLSTTIEAVLTGNFADSARLEAPSPKPESTHIYSLCRLAGKFQIRIDGISVAVNPCTTSAQGEHECVTPDLPFEPLHIGDWDYDLPGFAGTIYEVVILKASATAQAAVEEGLVRKYQEP